MALDKRLPAVYVEIEDRSYVSEPIEAGRTAYVVIISDRGPHNRVVELNSRQDLYDLFGKPNYMKFGQGHYFADQHLKRSGKIYVVRPVILEPIGDMSQDDCAAIANRVISLNSDATAIKIIPDNFTIKEDQNILTPSNPLGEPEQCPLADIYLSSAPQEGLDYLEFSISSVPDELILTNAIITQAKTAAGYTDTAKHFNIKYNTTLNLIRFQLVPDTSGTFDCATETLNYCNFIRPYKSTAAPVQLGTAKYQPVAGKPSGTIINFAEVTPDKVSIGDRISGLKPDPYGLGTGNEATTPSVTLTIDKSNIDNILSSTGHTFTDVNQCDINVRATASGLTVEVTSGLGGAGGTSGKGTFANYSTKLATTVLYENYDPVKIAGTVVDYIPALPPSTPGDINAFNVGDVIFVYGAPLATAEKYTIVSIDPITNEVVLDHPATATGAVQFAKYVEIESGSIRHMTSVKNIDTLSTTILWTFYTIGAGKYYNSIFIKGVRNKTYDRMYTDADGNPEYPYSFMDIAIYQDNGDNTVTMLEGPWTVSLMEKTSKDVIVRDVYTGLQLYLPVVINRKSKIVRVEESRGVDSLTTPIDSNNKITLPYQPDVDKRILLQNLISGKLGEYPNGIQLMNGSDGNMFDSMGRLIRNDTIKSIMIQAYNGSLKSEDGSIEKLLSIIYPWYYLNYIYVGGWDHDVNYAALTLADYRGDCLLLSDTGAYMENHTEEMQARQSLVPWNTWNAALYTNYRKIFDAFTSKYIWISPVYHAIDRHLYVDDKYWIAEPVAGIEKGAIEEAITLAYSTNETQLGDELDVELNPVLVESDGTYILQQFTTWKRLSVMKRQHVVKFVHFCKQQLPKILKDILHRKATTYWISQAQGRVNSFMNKFLDKGDTDRYAAITSYNAQCNFDEEESTLNVLLTIHPIRSIERINVNIIVT